MNYYKTAIVRNRIMRDGENVILLLNNPAINKPVIATKVRE
jgi:hypothetical protein